MSDNHSAHHVNYLLIFILLCLCTGASWIFDIMEINNYILLIFLVLAIATAKALFVMMFFMHLKFEGNWKYVLLAPTIILAMGLPLALMPDVGAHYYTVDIPQTEDVDSDHGDSDAADSDESQSHR